jgi:hypothetical protein
MSEPSSSSQVLAVSAASGEFVAVGSTGGHPAVWTTSEGRTWTTIVLDLPPGASAAQLSQIAIDGTHVAALGQQTTPAGRAPFAEMSSNSGASWQHVRFGQAGAAVTALTHGSSGFTAATP